MRICTHAELYMRGNCLQARGFLRSPRQRTLCRSWYGCSRMERKPQHQLILAWYAHTSKDACFYVHIRTEIHEHVHRSALPSPIYHQYYPHSNVCLKQRPKKFALGVKTDIKDLDPKTGFGQALVVFPEGVDPKTLELVLYPHGGPHSAFHSGFLPQVVGSGYVRFT